MSLKRLITVFLLVLGFQFCGYSESDETPLSLQSLPESYYDGLPARTLVVANLASSESVELARYYAKRRGIPLGNILYISCPDQESISWSTFVDKVFNPLRSDLVSRGWVQGRVIPEFDSHGRYKIAANKLKIAYLVTTRGVPISIADDAIEKEKDKAFDGYEWKQTHTTAAALDMELSVLAVGDSPLVSVLRNPYFKRGQARAEGDFIIKTSRIDGPSLDICKRIIDDSIAAEESGDVGRGFVDIGGPSEEGDVWFRRVVELFELNGIDFEKEDTKALASSDFDFSRLSFYFGWYSNHYGGGIASEQVEFLPGSIALHLHSFSGKIRSETKGWTGPLLANGASVSVGNVNEPYLQMTHRPDYIVEALFADWNIGDTMALAVPMLSWQAMHIGDPLYRPFLNKKKQQ